MDVTNSAPMGGTELICANLKAALPELTSKVQIIMSRPEQVELEDKPRILWLQDLPQDPASQCLKDKSYRSKFNRIVFCSNWQQQMYAAYLGIPFSEGVVIKNAVPLLAPKAIAPVPAGEKIRFIYTSTPHRGLALLAGAAEALAQKRQDWTLDVYSSLNIYGWHEQDKNFDGLYDSLRNNPCVNYHGSVPNAQLRQAVNESHVFVYPSIYPETSCMAVQEAMMAGCLAIVSSCGALIETCGEWGWMLPYTEDHNRLANMTLNTMDQAIDTYNEAYLQKTLRVQSTYFQNYYSFEQRVPMWKQLLETVVNEKPAVETLSFGA